MGACSSVVDQVQNKLNPFKDGNTVVLSSAKSGGNLRIKEDNTVDGNGKNGKWVKFVVAANDDGSIRLTSKHLGDGNALRINDEDDAEGLNGNGKKGKHTKFTPKKMDDGLWVLESTAHPGCHVGVKEDGSPVKPQNCKTGDRARWTVTVEE
jgi:hypothetical protein